MKVSKLLLMGTVAAVAMGGLHGCTEGDQTSISLNSTSAGGGNTGNNTISTGCPDSFTTARPQTDDGQDVCQLNNVIVSDVTLTNNIIWRINGRVTVGNGDGELQDATTLTNGDPLLNVTMTINAGTQIVAADAFTPATFSNLNITRGSRILANGTEADPIIFSSEDEGFDGNQEWGGLVISGFAPHNVCGAGTCNVDGEANAGFIGGNDANDDSGVLRYVIVAEAGEIINNDGDEINGISFNAVGNATTVEYIQVHGNTDDGVEFYGGTVNARYVVLTANQDDSLDWDEGYSGNIQYLLVVQAAGSGDFCLEADTLSGGSNPPPESVPTIANATFVCAGDPEGEAFNLKEDTGGFFHHTIIDRPETAGVGAPDFCLLVAADTQDNRNISLGVNQFICDDDMTFELAPGGTPSISTTTVASVEPALNALFASTAAEANNIAMTDFDTFNGAFAASNADSGFLDMTDYIGAVDPDATEAWWAGWTLPGTVVAP